MTPFLRLFGAALIMALLILLLLQLGGCAVLDDRYDAVRGDCELVPVMGLVVDEFGVMDWSVVPQVWC